MVAISSDCGKECNGGGGGCGLKALCLVSRRSFGKIANQQTAIDLLDAFPCFRLLDKLARTSLGGNQSFFFLKSSLPTYQHEFSWDNKLKLVQFAHPLSRLTSVG